MSFFLLNFSLVPLIPTLLTIVTISFAGEVRKDILGTWRAFEVNDGVTKVNRRDYVTMTLTDMGAVIVTTMDASKENANTKKSKAHTRFPRTLLYFSMRAKKSRKVICSGKNRLKRESYAKTFLII